MRGRIDSTMVIMHRRCSILAALFLARAATSYSFSATTTSYCPRRAALFAPSSSLLRSSKGGGDDNNDSDDWYADFSPQAYVYKERDYSGADNSAGRGGGAGQQRYGQDRFSDRGGGGRGGGRGGGGRGRGGGGGGSGRYGASGGGGGGGGYERDASADNSNVDVAAVERLIGDRTAARRANDFDAADQIRDELLTTHGVQVWDKERTWRTGASASGSGARRPGGRGGDFGERGGGGGRYGGDRDGGSGRRQRPPKDFGPTGHDYSKSPDAGPNTVDASESEINELIAARLQAKMSRNFDEADRIQNELTDVGVYVHDGMKEWRADGVMFGDYANGDRPGRVRGSRSDREQPFTQSPYSTGIDTLTEDQVADITAMVSRRAGAKVSRNFKTADGIRDALKDDFNVFVEDRLRQWSVGGDFGPEAPSNQDARNRPWAMSMYSIPAANEEQEAAITAELERRNEAKRTREFDVADDIRELLSSEYNVAIDDRLREWSIGGDFGLPSKTRDGPFVRRGGGELTDDEVEEISEIVEERANAKKNRDFENADELRDLLEARFSVKVDDKSALPSGI